jgi:tRNA (Thr-GGU) A37 N-methylase
VFDDYLPGLVAIAGFSHLILLYWLDEAPHATLRTGERQAEKKHIFNRIEM